MIVYKIRSKYTGLYKIKYPRSSDHRAKWNEVGDTYADLGTAMTAARLTAKAACIPLDDLEIIVFELHEISQVNP